MWYASLFHTDETLNLIQKSGNLGKAILRGIVTSRTSNGKESKDLPAKTPSNFIACVNRAESASALKDEFSSLTSNLQVYHSDNAKGLRSADVVLLACKPYMAKGILQAPGVKEALQGKLLISILAGVPVSQLQEILYGSEKDNGDHCKIVRVMPNTAAGIGESMTVIATSTPPLGEDSTKLVNWMFTRIGSIAHMPAHLMDAGTALCGSGPAFYALMLEAMADGGVAMGIPRKEAQLMAAQTMKGAAGMVLNGEHPAILRDKVSTPGGCTIGGLLVLEEGQVRGTISRAVREATMVASMLGKGAQNVNGTRH
jgi:pyrroline-5-carboxylate reductase